MGMKVVYRLKLGQDEFELHAEVRDEKDFFETMAFYSNLPKAAPNGATDLKLVFRTTKKGHKYYSLISEIEKKEFKLGQNLEANGGGLFCKGWDDLFNADQDEGDDQSQQASAAIVAAPAKVASASAAAKVTTAKTTVTKQAITPAAVVGAAPAVAAPVPQTITPTPAAAPAPAATPAANPKVSASAANVLSRFGINK